MKMTIDRIEGTLAVVISREDEPVRMNPPRLTSPTRLQGRRYPHRIDRTGCAGNRVLAHERVSGLIEKLETENKLRRRR